MDNFLNTGKEINAQIFDVSNILNDCENTKRLLETIRNDAVIEVKVPLFGSNKIFADANICNTSNVLVQLDPTKFVYKNVNDYINNNLNKRIQLCNDIINDCKSQLEVESTKLPTNTNSHDQNHEALELYEFGIASDCQQSQSTAKGSMQEAQSKTGNVNKRVTFNDEIYKQSHNILDKYLAEEMLEEQPNYMNASNIKEKQPVSAYSENKEEQSGVSNIHNISDKIENKTTIVDRKSSTPENTSIIGDIIEHSHIINKPGHEGGNIKSLQDKSKQSIFSKAFNKNSNSRQ